MADQLEGARLLPVKFRDEGDGSAAELLEVVNPTTRPVPIKPDRGAATFSGSHTTSATPSTSSEVRPANAARKEVEITNISDTTVYLGLLGAAVLEAGIPLYAGSSWDNARSTEQINSISAGVSKKLTVVER